MRDDGSRQANDGRSVDAGGGTDAPLEGSTPATDPMASAPLDPRRKIELIDPDEAAARPLQGRLASAITVVATAFTLWILYTAWTGPPPNLVNRAIFLIFGVILLFMLFPARKGRREVLPPWYDWLAMFAAVGAGLWVIREYDRFITGLSDPTEVDLVMATIVLFVVLEGSRRVVGWEFTAIIALVLAYAFFGHVIPGLWGHPALSNRAIMETLYMTTTGFFGSVTGIVATTVAGYVIFGALVFHTGSGDTFIKLALLLAGPFIGGAAKVATVASGFFGMISGSSAANVATTGAFTIPMMKRLGYGRTFSGAVEAAASTGGQIMPPIMGAGAFVMAEFVGVPYIDIAKAAFLPAVLYYLGIGATVHFEALNRGLRPVPRAEIPKARDVFNGQFVRLVIPVVVLVMLLLRGRSAGSAVFLPTMLVIALYVLSVRGPRDLWQRLRGMVHALDMAGRSLVLLVFLAIGAQIIISMVSITGVGTKFSQMVIGFSHENLLGALVLTALVCTVLGMGVATVADYVLAASVIVPALIAIMGTMGYLEQDARFIAHLFILYWASSSSITPPVCAAVFVAVGIAKSKVIPTGVRACQLGMAAFIAPFIFVYAPALLGWGTAWEVVTVFGTALAGIVILAAGVAGYFLRRATALERLALMAAGVMLLWPDLLVSLAGAVLAAAVYVWQRYLRPAPPVPAPAAAALGESSLGTEGG